MSEEDSVVIEGQEGGAMSTQGSEPDHSEVDPLWKKLMKRPFFKNAEVAQQKIMYMEELDRLERIEREERRERIEREECDRRERIEREKEEREFELRKLQLAQPTPQNHPAPTPGHRIKIDLPQFEDKTKIDRYLTTCEKLLQGALVAEDTWVSYVLPKLPERARDIYNRLPISTANDYQQLKSHLLDHYAVSPVIYRRNFFNWAKREPQTHLEYVQDLKEQLHMWIRSGGTGDETIDWEDLLLRYRLDLALSEEVQLQLLDKGKTSWKVEECARFADDYAVNRKVVHKAKGADRGGTEYRGRSYGPPGSGKDSGTSSTVGEQSGKGKSSYRSTEITCYYCQKKGHIQRDCSLNPRSPKYQGPKETELSAHAPAFAPKKEASAGEAFSNFAQTPTDEVVHPLYRRYVGDVHVGHASAKLTYLRDTGSTITLVSKDAVPDEYEPTYLGEEVTITGFRRHAGTFPLCKLHLECDLFSGEMTVALVDVDPLPGVAVLLGNDLEELTDPIEVPCGVVTRSQVRQTPKTKEVREGELPILFQEEESGGEGELQVEAEESYTVGAAEDMEEGLSEEEGDPPEREQRPTFWEGMDSLTAIEDPKGLLQAQEGDPTLTPLWGLTQQKGQGYCVQPETGCLMYQEPDTGSKDSQGRTQIVVPRSERVRLLRWAHEVPSAGHVGSKKVLERLKRHFTWPGIRKEVQDFCRGCGPCQRIGKGQQVETAPLKALPVIGRPFSLISADFVGPLPKTNLNNRFLLTVIDHATKYVEAIPLPVADTEHTKRAFVEIFSRHGLPQQILTDCGSVFVGEGFKQFLLELGIEPLLTSVYRPQSNGTLERAHGTLKAMIMTGLEEEPPGEWDVLLPWVLFAYRSAVHGSTGFTPFMLMYGREPTDILGLVSMAWLGETLDDLEVPAARFVSHLQERLQRIRNEGMAQQEKGKQSATEQYNRRHKVKVVKFSPGEHVLVHLPTRGKPLTGAWQGPYLIQEAAGQQSYWVNLPDKKVKRRKFHVNALKKWIPRPIPAHTMVMQAAIPPGVTLGDIMDQPPVPTELEVRMDPGNYAFQDCQPDGDLPDLQHLEPDQQAQVVRIFEEFGCLFAGPIGRMRGVTHDVDVGDHPPIRQNYYRTSPQKLEIIRQEVNSMMGLGVIQASRSEWASPLILVKKPEGAWRPCIDYRQVNQITKGETYPLPRLDDLVDQVGSAAYITTLDMAKGYWQIDMTARAREVSAFVTPFGHYEFNTMPFGMKLAPMTFQRAMNQLMEGITEFATAYLDDLAIRSSSWEEHVRHLQVVFGRLAQAGITLNSKKCTIGGARVKYLGHQVGSGEVAPLQAKVAAIAELPRPTTKTEIRSFLGSVGFYRKFLPYYSETAAPLTNLLKGGRKGDVVPHWTPECERAFLKLKQGLVEGPILKAPDFSQDFEIYTDASEVGIAAVLTQEAGGYPHPVAYYSRKLLDRETRYSTIEKELLAIMAALDNFHVYVGFGPVTIHSDHRPLVWLRQCTTANQRVLRWALALAEYDLTVEHIRGRDNCLADMLSRQIAD